jgi:Zn-dependent protease
VQDSVRFGRISGVTIGANWSVFALAGLVAYFLATSSLPADAPGYSHSAYWMAGILTALALLVSILVHELAHAVAGRKAKLHVDGITLWFMGGLTRIEGDSTKPSVEFIVGFVGPLASAVIGFASGGLSLLAGDAGWSLAAGTLRWLGLINVLLALFNLLPASPLDGGRVIHGLLWAVTRNRWLATRLTAAAGVGLGAMVAVVGVKVLGTGDGMDGMVLLVMAWFLISSARREQMAGRAQHVLGDVHVSDIMRPAVIAPGWLTVNAFWGAWAAPYPDAAFVLERWGNEGWSGVVTTQQLAAVAPNQQWSVRAQDVALPLSREGEDPLSPDQPALAVAGRGGIALPVLASGATVGVVLAQDLVAMVARGTPVQRRTWGNLWPAPTWPT